ncbi:Vesicle transport protein SFT2C [Camponotus floridanus]|uniref:Vesicle transport protein n=1 Tax=Camponotus floridanus TaxID=104421 RepID=E2AGK8_CAMFO|nr:vesicle transport protein SFT2C [Camponotus floridanus]EFN67428.1 Vesicle transport protein SFT2C [Camponotus floridanus]
MADLNKELNEYLLNNKNEKQYKIAIPSVALPKANFRKWFGNDVEETREDTGWIQRSQRECCPAMTRTQRLISFAVCFLLGLLCFCLSAIYIPVLLLKARKFALLYSLGSIFFLMSFCFLWGSNYMKSLFTADKRCFTVSYFATLTGTLYFALHLQSTPLTILCAVLQLIAMLSFLISHIPGGTTGLMFFTRMFRSSVKSSLPV